MSRFFMEMSRHKYILLEHYNIWLLSKDDCADDIAFKTLTLNLIRIQMVEDKSEYEELRIKLIEDYEDTDYDAEDASDDLMNALKKSYRDARSNLIKAYEEMEE